MRFYSQAQKIPVGQSMFSIIEFTFSKEWKGFTKIAQFKQYSNAYNVDITDDQCYVPSELLVGKCSLRIRGYSEEQQDVIATANELILTCVQGFESEGIPPVPPTPDLYQKLVGNFDKKIGNLSDLATDNKDNLVKAINEAKSSAVQSDWSENDESSPSYIKNRICYEEETTEEVTYSGEIINSLTQAHDPIPFVLGETVELELTSSMKLAFDPAVVTSEDGQLVAKFLETTSKVNMFTFYEASLKILPGVYGNVNPSTYKIIRHAAVTNTKIIDPKYLPKAGYAAYGSVRLGSSFDVPDEHYLGMVIGDNGRLYANGGSNLLRVFTFDNLLKKYSESFPIAKIITNYYGSPKETLDFKTPAIYFPTDNSHGYFNGILYDRDGQVFNVGFEFGKLTSFYLKETHIPTYVINISKDDNGQLTVDKSKSAVKSALDSGCNVVAVYNGNQYAMVQHDDDASALAFVTYYIGTIEAPSGIERLFLSAPNDNVYEVSMASQPIYNLLVLAPASDGSGYAMPLESLVTSEKDGFGVTPNVIIMNPVNGDDAIVGRVGIFAGFIGDGGTITWLFPGTSYGLKLDLNSESAIATSFINAPSEFYLSSSTENSTKKFKVTIDDTGALTTTEVTI